MAGKRIDLRVDQPHTARMYDYYLGGKDNYEADRQAVDEVEKIFPTIRLAAQTNRDWMHRVTRFLAQQGIRQFLDIGTGIPTEPNLHQIAQSVTPDARVVYVDHDPIVLAHARALLVSKPEGRTAFIPADVTTPQAILDSTELHDTLDLTQPVALSLISLLHFIPDEQDAYGIVRTLMNALAPGSYLALSHATGDYDPALAARGIAVYHAKGLPFQVRSRDEFTHFFDGLELVDPRIAVPHRWRPDHIEPPRSVDAKVAFYAAVARK